MNICVFGSASDRLDAEYIVKVEKLCFTLAQRGHNLVFGAGGNGVMGAAAKGFNRGGATVLGIIPSFFEEQEIEMSSEYCTQIVYTKTMAARKAVMEENADAFLIAPGGVGTFEEFFEVLTLKQLDCHTKPIGIYNIDGYYDSMLKMLDTSIEKKFLRSNCLELFKVFDESQTDELFNYLENDKYVYEKTLKELGYGKK